MSTDEKYQAGEAYGDSEEEPSGLLANASSLAKYLWNTNAVARYFWSNSAGVEHQVTPKELGDLITGLAQKGQPLDDKKAYVQLMRTQNQAY